ncbi:MAG: SGNH/GDSL hydrolase family protein [Thermodesulfobacteriota bacterium]
MDKEPVFHAGSHNAGEKISAGKKALFNMIFCLLIVIILVLTEIGLRVAGYGIDTRPFISPRYLEDTYITNVNLFKKYYPRRALTRPDTVPDMMSVNKFSREKAAATLRGFIVGESTAQGFPYQPNQSFGKMTELALAAGGKYEKVETINLGLSAITSYCVRDMASKILAYQPDFLVIYAGHNDYYGTISATTGGNYVTKTLYLALAEIRIFQFLFNLRNMIHPPPEYATLMEEQFSQQRIPLKPEMDREVAVNFVKNIDAIVKQYRRHNIPVIIIEPVSNIYDMPPFSGEKDDDFKDFIQDYAAVVKSGKVQDLASFYQERMSREQVDGNANVRYLDALARKKLTGKTDRADFIAARELDAIPFRAKEVLLKSLRDYCRDHSSDNPGLCLIPLGEIMAQLNGEAAFGNEFFIDHVHFTQAGQRLVSRILAERIADIFKFNEAEKGNVTDFYRDDVLIDQVIHCLPACRTQVYRTMSSLREHSPYNQMLIPYHREDVDGLTEADVDPQMVKILQDSQSKKMDYPVILAALNVNQGRIEEGRQYLDLYQWIYPGNYRPYLIRARFKKTFTKDIGEIIADYETAYLLSDKLKMIYDEVAAFTGENAREDLMARIDKHGDPVE